MENINNTAIQGYLPRTPVWLGELEGILCIIISLVGFVANFYTICAILRTPKLRNASSGFLLSLNATDLLFCSITLPFYAAQHLGSKWVENYFLCVFVPFLFNGSFSVCLFAIAGITVNRFIKIVHRKAYEQIFNPRNVVAIISFEWVFGFMLIIPTLFGVWGKFGYDPADGYCKIILDDNGHTSKENLFIIVFLLTFVVIGFCYARILYVVIRSSKRANSGNELSLLIRMKMAFIIFITFILCFLPISLLERFDKNNDYAVLRLIGHQLSFSSSIIHPTIYVVMNKQYRAACLSLLQDMLQALRLS